MGMSKWTEMCRLRQWGIGQFKAWGSIYMTEGKGCVGRVKSCNLVGVVRCTCISFILSVQTWFGIM